MWTALLLAAAAVPCAPGVDKNLLKAMERLLEEGDARQALALLESGDLRDGLADDSEALHSLCHLASNRSGLLARKREDGPKLAALLEQAAEACAGSHSGEANAFLALGYARLASARVGRLVGAKDATPDRWEKAADALEKAYELEPGNGDKLAGSVQVLSEAAGIPGADAAALLSRAAAVSGKAVEKHPGSVPVVSAASFLDLARARRALEGKDKGGAQALLDQGLARLAPMMKANRPDLDLATAHNEIVAFLRSHPRELKAGKADFVTEERAVGPPLKVQVPLSRFWSQDGDRVQQFSSSYENLRTFYFDSYSWDTNWRLADGTRVGGDNIKGLATNYYEISLRDMRKVQSKKPPVKRRMNGALDEGFLYEVVGEDGDGDFYFERTWFFKSKAGNMTTFRVSCYEHAEGAVLDVTGQAFLDGIREVSRK